MYAEIAIHVIITVRHPVSVKQLFHTWRKGRGGRGARVRVAGVEYSYSLFRGLQKQRGLYAYPEAFRMMLNGKCENDTEDRAI